MAASYPIRRILQSQYHLIRITAVETILLNSVRIYLSQLITFIYRMRHNAGFYQREKVVIFSASALYYFGNRLR